jgi:hypothetical protein
MNDLDEIERACKEATPGPWRNGQAGDENVFVAGPSGRWVAEVEGDMPGHCLPDAAFIANARQWVPALVTEVRRLRALTETLRAEYRSIATDVRAAALEEAAATADSFRNAPARSTGNADTGYVNGTAVDIAAAIRGMKS